MLNNKLASLKKQTLRVDPIPKRLYKFQIKSSQTNKNAIFITFSFSITLFSQMRKFEI